MGADALRRAAGAFGCAAILVGAAACRQDMHDQPKVKAYSETAFFADRRGMRPIPENTVARGFLNEDDHLFTGKVNGQVIDECAAAVTIENAYHGCPTRFIG